MIPISLLNDKGKELGALDYGCCLEEGRVATGANILKRRFSEQPGMTPSDRGDNRAASCLNSPFFPGQP